MDIEDKIQLKIMELLKLRNILLNQQPTDMVEVAHVTEMIVDLNALLMALSQQERLRPLSDAERIALQNAVSALQQAINGSAALSQIMAAATALKNV